MKKEGLFYKGKIPRNAEGTCGGKGVYRRIEPTLAREKE